MDGLKMVFDMLGLDVDDITKQFNELLDVAKDRLEKVDHRLQRIEEALNIKGDENDGKN